MQTLSEISKLLRQDAIEALLNHEIWWTYRSPDVAPLYESVMDQYPIFFRTTINAHFVAMVLPLYRIYETRQDSHNLPQLLRQLRKNKVVADDLLNNFDNQFKALKPTWIKITTLRNEVFGHRSNKYTVEESFERAKISPAEISSFIDKSLSLLNEVDSELNESYLAYQTTSGEEARQILETLKNDT